MNEVYLSNDIEIDSIVNGPGLRAVIWFQGCLHNCFGCHNPETHPLNVGNKMMVTDVFKLIDNLEDQDGITFSGGDPFFQPEAFLEILKYVKEKGYNVWAYTGFTFEALLKKDSIYTDILKNIDVLVDGKFDLAQKSFECKFRGSKNQRIIDVTKSLNSGKVVEYI